MDLKVGLVKERAPHATHNLNVMMMIIFKRALAGPLLAFPT